MLLGWTVRSTGLSLEFLAVPVLLISVTSGQLLTSHVLPVIQHGMEMQEFSETIFYMFSVDLYGAELCYLLVLVLVSFLSFFFLSIIAITTIVIIIRFFRIFVHYHNSCRLLHYGANKGSYIIYLAAAWSLSLATHVDVL